MSLRFVTMRAATHLVLYVATTMWALDRKREPNNLRPWTTHVQSLDIIRSRTITCDLLQVTAHGLAALCQTHWTSCIQVEFACRRGSFRSFVSRQNCAGQDKHYFHEHMARRIRLEALSKNRSTWNGAENHSLRSADSSNDSAEATIVFCLEPLKRT